MNAFVPSKMAASLAVFGAALATGCIIQFGDAKPSSGELVNDCVVPLPVGLSAWGAPVSFVSRGRTSWIFDAVTSTDGTLTPNALAFVEDGDGACAGRVEFELGNDGAPANLLALSDEEQASNAARADGRALRLAPRAALSLPDGDYIFYEQVLRGLERDADVTLGTGICRRVAGGEPCVRLTDSLGSTLLFPADLLRVASILQAGDQVYLLSCVTPAVFERTCGVVRVPAAELANPRAYERRGFSAWEPIERVGLALSHDLGANSFAYNAYQRQVTLISLDPFDGRVSLRLASEPDGPFGDVTPLFSVAPAAQNELLGGGTEEVGFRREADRLVSISYFTSNPRSHGLHVASFRFRERTE